MFSSIPLSLQKKGARHDPSEVGRITWPLFALLLTSEREIAFPILDERNTFTLKKKNAVRINWITAVKFLYLLRGW